MKLKGLDKITELESSNIETVPAMEQHGDAILPLTPYNFGVDEDTKRPAPKVPIKRTMLADKIIYEVVLFDVIWNIDYYVQLISLLETADANTTFIIQVGSPGGSINIGTNIGSTIIKSKATVIGIAVGEVASIAMFIWSCCDKQYIMDGAVFLFHMSSHGDHGQSTLIRDRAEDIIYYVNNYLLKISLERGHLLPEEHDIILSKKKDIIISCNTMRQRLKNNPNYLTREALLGYTS